MTFAPGCGILSLRGSLRSFGGCPRGYPCTAKAAQPKGWAAFLFSGLLRENRRSEIPQVNSFPGGPVGVSPPVNKPEIVNRPPVCGAWTANRRPRSDLILRRAGRPMAVPARPTQQNLCYFVALVGSESAPRRWPRRTHTGSTHKYWFCVVGLSDPSPCVFGYSYSLNRKE